MPPVTIQQLHEIIEKSEVLTVPEKQEWLRLIEFMNDKQLLDLYTILVPEEQGKAAALAEKNQAQVQVPESSPASGLPPAPVSNTATIGEGASLSAFLERTKTGSFNANPTISGPIIPPSSPPLRSARFIAWKKQVDSAMQEKELPGVVPATQASPFFPTIAAVEPPVLTPISPIENTVQPTVISPVEPQPPVVPPEQDVAIAPPVIKSIEDVVQIGVPALRSLGVAGLYEKLSVLVKSKGYFSVLFVLEKSPLYAAYVHTGMKLIEMNMGFEQFQEQQSPTPTYLNRAEFESFADMLRNLGSA